MPIRARSASVHLLSNLRIANILAAFNQLMLTFWSICLFRKGPAALPVNHPFLGITVIIHLILTFAVNEKMLQFLFRTVQQEQLIAEISSVRQIGEILFSTVVYVAMIYFVLRFFNKSTRAFQTIFALFGTGIIFGGFLLVGTAFLTVIPLIFSPFLLLPLLALGIWSLFVSGNILAQAIEISRLKGTVYVVLILLTQALITTGISEFLAYVATPAATSAT